MFYKKIRHKLFSIADSLCSWQAVSSLSTRMELLRNLITPSRPSSSGLYSVRLFNQRNGNWENILLDDYVPVDTNRRPCFARCHDPNTIWIMLLEKAFAKLHGSYRQMSQVSYAIISFHISWFCYIIYSVTNRHDVDGEFLSRSDRRFDGAHGSSRHCVGLDVDQSGATLGRPLPQHQQELGNSLLHSTWT